MNNYDLIPLSEGAALVGCTREHLNHLARTGKIKAQKMGRNWFTSKIWLEGYFGIIDVKKRGDIFYSENITRELADRTVVALKEAVEEVDRLKREKQNQAELFTSQMAEIKNHLIGEQEYKNGFTEELQNLKNDLRRTAQAQVRGLVQNFNQKDELERQIGFLRDSFGQAMEQLRYVTEQTISDQTSALAEDMNECLQEVKISDAIERMRDRFIDNTTNFDFFDYTDDDLLIPSIVTNNIYNEIEEQNLFSDREDQGIANYPVFQESEPLQNQTEILINTNEYKFQPVESGWTDKESIHGNNVFHLRTNPEKSKQRFRILQSQIALPARYGALLIGVGAVLLSGIFYSADVKRQAVRVGTEYLYPAVVMDEFNRFMIQGAEKSFQDLALISGYLEDDYSSVPASRISDSLAFLLNQSIALNIDQKKIQSLKLKVQDKRQIMERSTVDAMNRGLQSVVSSLHNFSQTPGEVAGAFIEFGQNESDDNKTGFVTSMKQWILERSKGFYTIFQK